MNTVTFLRKAGAVTFLDLNSGINEEHSVDPPSDDDEHSVDPPSDDDEHSVDPPSDDGYAVQDELLDSEITEEEVRKAIRTLKSEKSCWC